MASAESEHSAKPPLAIDLNLPEFEQPQLPHRRVRMSWGQVIRHFAPMREKYMREFDSPEKRLRDKNPHRFKL